MSDFKRYLKNHTIKPNTTQYGWKKIINKIIIIRKNHFNLKITFYFLNGLDERTSIPIRYTECFGTR